ncbi:MAG: DUF4249 family protein [Sphingobacteriales bacterium]|nr:MAG: DUF4249 family protein [Sphingobacteriales bacterium]
MKTLKFFALATAAISLYSCKPKPLNIDIKQEAPVLTISSATPDNHTVLVSAGYSINSLVRLNDGSNSSVKIPKEMLLKDGLLTLTKDGGPTDTLYEISDGLYGNTRVNLEHLARYTINVYESGKGLIGSAVTTYQQLPDVQYAEPQIDRRKGDTTVSVTVGISNIAPDDYYFISYNTTANARKQSPNAKMDVSTLASFTPKQLVLISGSEVNHGKIDKRVEMSVNTCDTLMVQTAKVDRAYFDYLTAYKRSGALINQLTGEPINMPSNVVKGFGFFSLFAPDRKVFYLKNY